MLRRSFLASIGGLPLIGLLPEERSAAMPVRGGELADELRYQGTAWVVTPDPRCGGVLLQARADAMLAPGESLASGTPVAVALIAGCWQVVAAAVNRIPLG